MRQSKLTELNYLGEKNEPERAIYLENKGKKGLKNESNNWIILSFNNIIVC